MSVVVDVFGGGLGNLLFMHHAGYALARDTHRELLIQAEYNDPKRPNVSEYQQLFQHAKMIKRADMHNLQGNVANVGESSFGYVPWSQRIRDDAQHVVIHGYFQSYKYFEKYTTEIRDLLWANVREQYENVATRFHADRPTICLHVRRGDYLHLPQYHPTQSDAYYIECLHHIQRCANIEHPLVIVFSDDPAYVTSWVRKIMPNTEVIIDDTVDPVECLIKMSLCDHFIIANSSLSLNAYYLRKNANALLCAPQQWFGPQGPSFNIRDLVPDDAFVA